MDVAIAMVARSASADTDVRSEHQQKHQRPNHREAARATAGATAGEAAEEQVRIEVCPVRTRSTTCTP